MTCQWTNLVNCIEDCDNAIYSPGLWAKVDPEACGGSALAANVSSPYYDADEFLISGSMTLYFYSDIDLSGTVFEITNSSVNPSGGYINTVSIVAEEAYTLAIFGFSATDPNLTPPVTFAISAIAINDNPIRSFEPITCFVLGSSYCA